MTLQPELRVTRRIGKRSKNISNKVKNNIISVDY
jgi:hypothetical protein